MEKERLFVLQALPARPSDKGSVDFKLFENEK